MRKKFEYSLAFEYPKTMEADKFLDWLKEVQERIKSFSEYLNKIGENCYVHPEDYVSVNNYKDKV